MLHGKWDAHYGHVKMSECSVSGGTAVKREWAGQVVLENSVLLFRGSWKDLLHKESG